MLLLEKNLRPRTFLTTPKCVHFPCTTRCHRNTFTFNNQYNTDSEKGTQREATVPQVLDSWVPYKGREASGDKRRRRENKADNWRQRQKRKAEVDKKIQKIFALVKASIEAGFNEVAGVNGRQCSAGDTGRRQQSSFERATAGEAARKQETTGVVWICDVLSFILQNI